jgi:hypothetical protein
VLYAESVMDLYPWRLWTKDRKPTPGTEAIIPTLESVLRRDPGHLGANHLYIHALEGSPWPERALASALLLPALAPRSPHLVHMPSHIFIHTGDYLKVVEANTAAIALGDDRFRCCQPWGVLDYGYHGHNLRFLIYAADMAGMSRVALDAAGRLTASADYEFSKQSSMPGKEKAYMQEMLEYDAVILARFNRWDSILRLAEHSNATPDAASRFHFTRALAAAARKNLSLAISEYRLIIGREYELGPTTESTAENFEQVAMADIAGCRIARARGDFETAIRFARAAVETQDAVGYREPPAMPWPGREELGCALLAAERWGEAERVFRESLAQFPRSGRALLGLEEALRHSGEAIEAGEVNGQFKAAWKNADVILSASDL